MIHHIEVENVKCGGCMNSITKALMKITGVESVNIENETISVSGNADKNIIVETLSKLGYPEKGNNDLFKKAKSFVSCAIGKMN
jgi:copper chaperone CopZ